MRARAESIVVITGAGISAESGIKTFRADDGLWENHPIIDVATPEGFEANPQLVYGYFCRFFSNYYRIKRYRPAPL